MSYCYDDLVPLEKGEIVLEGHLFYDIDGNLLTVDETDIGLKNRIDGNITYYKCKYGHQLYFPFYRGVKRDFSDVEWE